MIRKLIATVSTLQDEQKVDFAPRHAIPRVHESMGRDSLRRNPVQPRVRSAGPSKGAVPTVRLLRGESETQTMGSNDGSKFIYSLHIFSIANPGAFPDTGRGRTREVQHPRTTGSYGGNSPTLLTSSPFARAHPTSCSPTTSLRC